MIDLKTFTEAVDLLAPFGLIPAAAPNAIFESELIRAASAIRALYPTLDYDHRPTLPSRDLAFPYLLTEQFRVGYACFKYAVAAVLQPRSITEIGIGAGTGCRAFLAAAPTAHYIGIDDGSKDANDGWSSIDFLRGQLSDACRSFAIRIVDSRTLVAAPEADLFHVDGAHSFDNAFSDTRLAVESGSRWILVDDSRDPVVAAAAFAAVSAHASAGTFDWTHFEDTWTGSILFHRRSA